MEYRKHARISQITRTYNVLAEIGVWETIS